MVDAKLVMELRNETKLPMMKCKEALIASAGDKEAAITYLRKQGIGFRDRMSSREMDNGCIGCNWHQGSGEIVLLGCQTDFVANSDDFKDLVRVVTNIAHSNFNYSKEQLAALVEPYITDAVAKLRENISLLDVKYLSGDTIIGYNHGPVAGLVAGTGPVDKLRMVSLHVVSAAPIPMSLSRLDIDSKLVETERSIIASLPDVMAKPESIRSKVIDGKMNKFYKELILLEQEMLIDAQDKETVHQYCIRNGITITGFARISIK